MAWAKGDGTGPTSSPNQSNSKDGNSLAEPAKVVYRKAPRKPTADASTKSRIVKLRTHVAKNIKVETAGICSVIKNHLEPGSARHTTPRNALGFSTNEKASGAPEYEMISPPNTNEGVVKWQHLKRSSGEIECASDEDLYKEAHKKLKPHDQISLADDYVLLEHRPLNTFDRAFTSSGRPYDPVDFGTESFHERFGIRDDVIEEHANTSGYGMATANSYMGDAYHPNTPPFHTTSFPGSYSPGVSRPVEKYNNNALFNCEEMIREEDPMTDHTCETDIGGSIAVDDVFGNSYGNSLGMSFGNATESDKNEQRYDSSCLDTGNHGIYNTDASSAKDSNCMDPRATDWAYFSNAPGGVPRDPYDPYPSFSGL